MPGLVKNAFVMHDERSKLRSRHYELMIDLVLSSDNLPG